MANDILRESSFLEQILVENGFITEAASKEKVSKVGAMLKNKIAKKEKALKEKGIDPKKGQNIAKQVFSKHKAALVAAAKARDGAKVREEFKKAKSEIKAMADKYEQGDNRNAVQRHAILWLLLLIFFLGPFGPIVWLIFMLM